MKLQGLNFETWLKNHQPDHDAKWLRELYPFQVFQEIDFDEKLIGVLQRVQINDITYNIKITSIKPQQKSRFMCQFDIITIVSNSAKWIHREWNTTFNIVYNNNYYFVTVFSEGQDPTTKIIADFFRGKFSTLANSRSYEVFVVLARILINSVSKELFKNGEFNIKYSIKETGIKQLTLRPEIIKLNIKEYYPIYSIGRQLWICFTITEEDAHIVAYNISNQCHKLYVLYAIPTYRTHYKCNYADTEVISIYEFISLKKYSSRLLNEQCLFLLHKLTYDGENKIDFKSIQKDIASNTHINISEVDLLESLSIIKTKPTGIEHIFYITSSFNLINAWLNQKRSNPRTKSEDRLFKKMYSFKKHLSTFVDLIFEKFNQTGVSVHYSASSQLLMIQIFEFQFTFHNVPYTNDKLPQEHFPEWKGKRLQLVSPLILYFSRETYLSSLIKN